MASPDAGLRISRRLRASRAPKVRDTPRSGWTRTLRAHAGSNGIAARLARPAVAALRCCPDAPRVRRGAWTPMQDPHLGGAARGPGGPGAPAGAAPGQGLPLRHADVPGRGGRQGRPAGDLDRRGAHAPASSAGASSLSTWLYTIARSFCIKQRRRSKFAPESIESLDTGEPARQAVQLPDPAARPRGGARTAGGSRLPSRTAIGALEPMYREVLVLRDVEGLSAAEVAEVLGLTVEAVKSRLHRARIAVRERVAPALRAEPAAPEPSSSCQDVVAGLLAPPGGRDRLEPLRRAGEAPRGLPGLPEPLRQPPIHAHAVPERRRGARAGRGGDLGPPGVATVPREG